MTWFRAFRIVCTVGTLITIGIFIGASLDKKPLFERPVDQAILGCGVFALLVLSSDLAEAVLKKG